MTHIMYQYIFNKTYLQFKTFFFFSVPVFFNSCQTEKLASTNTKTSNTIHQWPKSLPELVDMSSSRLANLDSIFIQHIEQEKIPGMVALIVRNGFVVYEKAFGNADPLTNEPYKTDNIFRIASQTKAITATAV